MAWPTEPPSLIECDCCGDAGARDVEFDGPPCEPGMPAPHAHWMCERCLRPCLHCGGLDPGVPHLNAEERWCDCPPPEADDYPPRHDNDW